MFAVGKRAAHSGKLQGCQGTSALLPPASQPQLLLTAQVRTRAAQAVSKLMCNQRNKEIRPVPKDSTDPGSP